MEVIFGDLFKPYNPHLLSPPERRVIQVHVRGCRPLNGCRCKEQKSRSGSHSRCGISSQNIADNRKIAYGQIHILEAFLVWCETQEGQRWHAHLIGDAGLDV
jgi:hypothetical protein